MEADWIMDSKSMLKRRIHDGVAGLIIAIGIALGYFVSDAWFGLSLLISVLMIQSAFTSFCPVYFTLNKFIKD